jgi:TonB family protein
MPLLRGDELAGVFELFSSRTYAFGDREERALEALAQHTLKSLQLAAEPMELPVDEVEASSVVAEAEDVGGEEQGEVGTAEDGLSAPAYKRRDVNWIWTAAVLASAALLAVAVIVPSQWRKASPRSGTLPAAVSSGSSGGEANSSPSPAPHGTTGNTTKPATSNLQKVWSRESSDIDSIPAGSLSVYSEGKEVFHQAASGVGDAQQGTKESTAAETVIELSPAPDAAIVLKRVAPEYPAEARTQHIQGPVVLDVQIGAGGDVESVQVVSGSQALSGAASDAMKQWKFKPRTVDGVAQEMRTRVTLIFRLPR